MFEAVYMAATGLTNQQRRLDTIANNVSNVNTVGFKNSRLDFKDALYTAGFDPGPAYTEGGDLQKGHGVIFSAITNDFSVGSFQNTGNMLDFAIDGDAFFEVLDPYGNRLYTRAGNFYASTGPNGLELTNAQGYFVQDEDGNNISIPEGTTSIDVSPEGAVNFRAGAEILGTAQLGLYTFPNKTGLSVAGGGNYAVTDASGDAEAATEGRVIQYTLENSNVDMATEMTRLLRTQRAFSLASRALTTADDMEGIANNMKK